MNDLERLREIAHRLWEAEGKPETGRKIFLTRAIEILKRVDRHPDGGGEPVVLRHDRVENKGRSS